MTATDDHEENRTEKLGRLVEEALDRADTIFLLVAGATVGLLGVIGAIKGEDLTSATLFVLAVLGFSLLRERSMRLKANGRLDKIGEQIAETQQAVKSLHTGHPYHVLLDEVTWDIVQPDGDIAHVRRLKKLKFDQNNVLSLYEWSARDGTQENVVYAPGEKVGPTLNVEGKQYSLIALPRFYSRDEALDFCVTRTARGTFMGNREGVSVESMDIIAQLVMTVIWPSARPPESVRLKWVSASGDRQSQDMTLETKDGRPSLTIKVREPEKGSTNEIEWDWPSISSDVGGTPPLSRPHRFSGLRLLLSAEHRRTRRGNRT